MTTATLLDGADWAGNIFVGGSWRPGSAGDAPIIEPATGEELGRTGRAGVDDVATAAASAAEAQRDWAALPHTQRAAVLRKAGDLFTEHGDELGGWNVREVGAVPGMAGFALHVAAEECYAAAALTGRSARRADPERAAAALDGQAGPGRCGRGDLAVQRAADPEHPLGRPGAGARQLRAAEAGPAHRDDRRGEHRPRPRGGRTAGRRTPAGAGWRRRRRGPGRPTRTCASSPSPARPAPAARSASSPGVTSSARTSSSAATPRCWCSTTPTSRRRSTSPPGAPSSTRARSA